MINCKDNVKGTGDHPQEGQGAAGSSAGRTLGIRGKRRHVYIKKAVIKSPFDRWVGKLKHLKGQRSDDLVREIRGHDNRRWQANVILDVLIPDEPFGDSSKKLLDRYVSDGRLILCEIVFARAGGTVLA